MGMATSSASFRIHKAAPAPNFAACRWPRRDESRRRLMPRLLDSPLTYPETLASHGDLVGAAAKLELANQEGPSLGRSPECLARRTRETGQYDGGAREVL